MPFTHNWKSIILQWEKLFTSENSQDIHQSTLNLVHATLRETVKHPRVSSKTSQALVSMLNAQDNEMYNYKRLHKSFLLGSAVSFLKKGTWQHSLGLKIVYLQTTRLLEQCPLDRRDQSWNPCLWRTVPHLVKAKQWILAEKEVGFFCNHWTGEPWNHRVEHGQFCVPE